MFRRIKTLFPPRRLRPVKGTAVGQSLGEEQDSPAPREAAKPAVSSQETPALVGQAESLPASATQTQPATAPSSQDAPTQEDGTGTPKAQTPAQRTGSAGEAAAAEYLTGKGHRVLERNWRAGRDEIDLITLDGQALVFVEVRTRAQTALVGGFHSIDARKKAALRRVCGAYLQTRNPRPRTYRLDVVQISMGKGGQMTINHYAGIALFN